MRGIEELREGWFSASKLSHINSPTCTGTLLSKGSSDVVGSLGSLDLSITKREVMDCPLHCGEHGACNDDKSKCECQDGWYGPHCLSNLKDDDLESNEKCPNGCNGFGVCAPGGVCFCDKDHSGVDCSIKRCPGKYIDYKSLS